MGGDLWQSIKGLVGKVAPVLGNAIVPGVGGMAGSIIADVLGVENEPEQIDAALRKASPETLAKLKEAELHHKEKLIELGLERDKEYLKDRQDARKREIEIQKSGGSNMPMYILAGLVVGGFFGLMAMLLFRATAIPQGNQEVAFIMFGALASQFGTVCQYFFGSSKSSSDKTKLIAESQGMVERLKGVLK